MSQTVKGSDLPVDAVVKPPAEERHPWGLYVLFATEMWERFGFYTAAADHDAVPPARRVRLDEATRRPASGRTT